MSVMVAQLDQLLQHAWRVISLPSVALAIALVVCLVVTAVALLRYTRLGRTTLIWKCVVLSLISHVLLLVYACGTLFVNQPGSPISNNKLKVHLISHVESEDETTEEEPPIWEQFSNSQAMPEVNPLDRPLTEPELEIERVFVDPANQDIAMTVVPDSKVPELIERDIVQPNIPDRLSQEPDTSAAPTASTVEPTTIDNQRESSQPSAVLPDIDILNQAEPLTANVSGDWQPITRPLELHAATTENSSEKSAVPISPPADLQKLEMIDISKMTNPAQATSTPLEPADHGNRTLDPNPKRLADAQPMPKQYSLRGSSQRLLVAQSRGGSIETEKAVQDGLRWLAKNQQADGRWDPRLTGGGIERSELGQDRKGAGSRADNGITGLALLAFLADGNTHLEGPYRENVARGIQFLISTQLSDGFVGGQSQAFERMYCHGMAMLAISEALALTGDSQLVSAVRRAVEYSVRAQHPTDGGWRYYPGDTGDMSQFGWQVLSIHSAGLGGVHVPKSTVDGMHRFLHASTRGASRGLGCYRPGERHSPTMTAEALTCRYLLEDNVSRDTIDEATRFVIQNLPDNDEVNYYYWYYGTISMFHTGGPAWEKWNAQLQSVLLHRQVAYGADSGSWPADGLWSGYGGRVYSTAMATLCLEVYYRYLPVYELNSKK